MNRLMDMKRIFLAAALLWPVIPALSANHSSAASPDINKVRVTAERASVYIEPSRSSTRIDIVDKGTLLNLLQKNKVKNNWYHISYSSPRYGARVSGFVLDSSVELFDDTARPPLEEKKTPEKPGSRPPLPRPEPPVRPKVEEKKVTRSVPPPPKIEEALTLTTLPKSRLIVLPPAETSLLEQPWRVVEIVPARDKPALKTEEKVAPAPPPEKRREVEKKPAVAEPEVKPTQPQIIKPSRIQPQRRGPGGVSIGLGYGSSFGGAGACLQLSTGIGLALHGGAGIFPTKLIYSDTDWVKNETLWSVGLKYYIPIRSPLFYPYVDIQYGGLRVEAAEVVIGIWDLDLVYSKEQKSLWGPSFLTGVELRMGWFGVSGALGISYVTTSWEFLKNRTSLSFDTSLVVHF